MDDNRIKAVAPDRPEVIKGANFPTPMAMAPVQPSNDSSPQPTTPVAEAPSQPQDAGTATGGTDASSQE